MHVLAFENLAGDGPVPEDSAEWVRWSDLFAAQDNEPTVAELAADILTSPDVALNVTFASGGQLVRGASTAAASICSGRDAVRAEGTDKVIDRSVEALRASGWTADQVHQLLVEWARRDGAAQVALIDLDSPDAAEAMHELTCRYECMHSELDFISESDASQLHADTSGSTQVLCVRADGPAVSAVLDRHANAIRATASGPGAASMLATLWSSGRQVSPSAAHSQRVRKMRRRQAAGQLLDRARGR